MSSMCSNDSPAELDNAICDEISNAIYETQAQNRSLAVYDESLSLEDVLLQQIVTLAIVLVLNDDQ